MTCDEIQDLIEYLEKNYYVECELEGLSYDGRDRLVITPNLPMRFMIKDKFDKDNILNAVKDLIRF